MINNNLTMTFTKNYYLYFGFKSSSKINNLIDSAPD